MTTNQKLMNAYTNDKAVVLTQGTVMLVNRARYQALLGVGMLAEIPQADGSMCWGIEVGDDMILCEIDAVQD